METTQTQNSAKTDRSQLGRFIVQNIIPLIIQLSDWNQGSIDCVASEHSINRHHVQLCRMISALYRPEAVVQIPTQSHMVSEYVHGCVRLSACRIVICQPMQRDGGRLVRAVFITNYSPRTGFMIPQEREPWYNRRGPKPCACFAVRPLLIHHKRSFSGQLSPIFVRTKDLVTAGRPDRCWGKSKRRGFIADRSQKDVDLHLCVVAFNVPIHRCGRRFLGSEMLEQFNDTKVSTDLKIIPRGKIYSF